MKHAQATEITLNPTALTLARGVFVEATTERERLYWETSSKDNDKLPKPINEAIKAYLQHDPVRSAALELLETLKDMLDWRLGDRALVPVLVFEKARAAIAKAESTGELIVKIEGE